MKDTPNYFAVIPANVRYDKDLLAGAKLMFGEITALSNAKGYCFASNGYFANLYGCTNQAISKWIKQLEAKGYVKIKYVGEAGKQERRVSIAIDSYQPQLRGVSTGVEGVSTGVEHNNTSINSTSNNEREKRSRFSAPTVSDISEYMQERGVGSRRAAAEAEKMHDHFASNGWKVGGKTKMKDWKAAARNWIRRMGDFLDAPAPRPHATPPAPALPAVDREATKARLAEMQAAGKWGNF